MVIVPVQRHDVGVPFEDVLTAGPNDDPVDLTGATVLFILRRPKGAVITGTATIGSPATAGAVQYISQPGDLAVCGDHEQVWQVTWPGSPDRVYTFPNEGTNIVSVGDDLNDA